MMNPDRSDLPPVRIIPDLTALAAVLSLSACGNADEHRATLAERARFDGHVTLRIEEGEATRILVGDLEFDRAADTMRWTTTTDGTVSVLAHAGAAGLSKLVDGQLAATELTDAAEFALLSTLTHAILPATAQVNWSEGGYTVQMGERRIVVEFGPPPR